MEGPRRLISTVDASCMLCYMFAGVALSTCDDRKYRNKAGQMRGGFLRAGGAIPRHGERKIKPFVLRKASFTITYSIRPVW